MPTYTYIIKTRQANLRPYSCSGQGKALGGVGVQYICLIGCRLSPLDGYVAVRLVLTIDVYDGNQMQKFCNIFLTGGEGHDCKLKGARCVANVVTSLATSKEGFFR